MPNKKRTIISYDSAVKLK